MNLPTASVDPWVEILHLLPQKVTYKGAVVNGDPKQLQGFANWLMQQLPGVVSDGDPEHRASVFLLWLRSETRYEADRDTRMAQQAQVQVAPPNPISHQTVPQQAQMAAPIPQPVIHPTTPDAATGEVESGPGLVCPECQTKTSGLRGIKRHVTMTHKTEWPAFCSKHGLDTKTGLPGTAPAAPAPVTTAVPAPPAASPVPPMFQASGPPQPFTAPAPPPMPTAPQTFAAPAPFNPPAMPAPFNPPAMPAPAAIVAAPAPLSLATTQALPAGPMVAFDPNAIQPGLPGQQNVPFVSQPIVQQQPPVWQSPIQPLIAQQPSAPVPQFQAQPAQPVLGAPSRDEIARMLGGAIDLIIVRLLDAATINLQGRADVNQLAATAELKARSELKVNELASVQYGVGKQTAQRHFGELLSQTPGCYMLLNGYDPILPDGYLDILAARVTKFHIVTDGGRQTTTIF